ENIIPQILEVLYQHQIQSIIIEGGLQTIQTFINQDIWDEARIFKGNNSFIKGTKAPVLSGKILSKINIRNDELIQIRNHD
ncbi:dihydrofolate reductase family protein, partial [Staphylococcus aureus]|uniref:dihydrofolate reductase family protein n=1 Tax=Staphylococcus aureus TaxID=1280 RepID=UPI003D09FBB1